MQTVRKRLLSLTVAASVLLTGYLCGTSAALAATESGRLLLKTGVSETVSPIAADGSTNKIESGTPVTMTMVGNLNSEVSKVGSEVVAMVSLDCKNGGKVILPGQWCVHGVVSEVEHQRRLGRDGFVTVKFDKLVSPDGKYQVPIDISATTHESTAKAVAKVVAKDTIYVSKGAAIGAFTSVKFTGIPLAIATHGYSVAAGAAVGGLIGLGAALHRKGKIMCGLPGEELQFRFDKDVVLPAFNAEALPSAMPAAKVVDLNVSVVNHAFMPNPLDDKSSSLLRVSFKMKNDTSKPFSFSHLVIVSDHNKMYFPYVLSADSTTQRKKIVEAYSEEAATITFDVDSRKRKYFLVLLDRFDKEELSRVPIN